MLGEGHAIGLHSATRADMLLSPEALGEKLTAAANRIESLGGTPPCRAFRPHTGWRGGEMYGGLKRIDYTLVGWGWMPWDWNWFRARTGDSTLARITTRVSAGDHHRHARRGRIGAAEGAAADSAGHGAPDFRSARARILLRNSLPERGVSRGGTGSPPQKSERRARRRKATAPDRGCQAQRPRRRAPGRFPTLLGRTTFQCS